MLFGTRRPVKYYHPTAYVLPVDPLPRNIGSCLTLSISLAVTSAKADQYVPRNRMFWLRKLHQKCFTCSDASKQDHSFNRAECPHTTNSSLQGRSFMTSAPL